MSSEVFTKWLGPKPRERLLWGGGLLLLLCIFVILLPYFYVRAEHTFHSNDPAHYQDLASAETADFRASPVWAVDSLMASLADQYNRIFTVPLVPLMVVFGDSRVVFITGLALLYLLPFALVLGAIGSKLFPLQPRKAFCFTALLTLLVPTIWMHLLRGWPDVGAAFVIGLAIWVHLDDRFLGRTAKIVLVGLLVVAAMLFREQYAYDALAVYGAIGLQIIFQFAWQVKKDRAGAVRQFLDDIVYIGLAGILSLVALGLVGWPCLFRVLAHNYQALYSSYSEPLGAVLSSYPFEYGWGVLLLAILGYVAGLSTGLLASAATIFLLLFGGISFLEWVVVVRYTGPLYALHFALVVVPGIASLCWVIWSRTARQLRALMFAVIVLFLLFNLVNSLAPVRWITNERIQRVFAMHFPPSVRRDYHAVSRLIAYLRDVTRGEPIYIVASSGVLNPSLVKNAELTLYGSRGSVLHIVDSPEIDSRDFYPLEPLLKTDYVVLAIPFQHQLPVHDQEVVKTVYDAFTENRAIAGDFARLPTQFTLENGVVVSIYRRIRTTSPETALLTLLKIQNMIGQTPRGQAGWLILGQLPQSTVNWEGTNTYDIKTLLFGAGDSDATSFAYPEALPAQAKVSGTVAFEDDGCSGVTLHFATLNRQGAVTDVANIVRRPGDAPQFDSSPFRTQGAVDLLLTISRADPDPTGSCAVRIDHLNVLGK